MEDEFNTGKKKHDVLWGACQRMMKEKGVDLSTVKINNKWNALNKRYKEVKDNNRKTGTERKDCKYEECFDELLGEKASTNPIYTIDSNNAAGASGSGNQNIAAAQITQKKVAEKEVESKKKKQKTSYSQTNQFVEELVESGK